jgi:hypothetical protein
MRHPTATTINFATPNFSLRLIECSRTSPTTELQTNKVVNKTRREETASPITAIATSGASETVRRMLMIKYGSMTRQAKQMVDTSSVFCATDDMSVPRVLLGMSAYTLHIILRSNTVIAGLRQGAIRMVVVFSVLWFGLGFRFVLLLL